MNRFLEAHAKGACCRPFCGSRPRKHKTWGRVVATSLGQQLQASSQCGGEDNAQEGRSCHGTKGSWRSAARPAWRGLTKNAWPFREWRFSADVIGPCHRMADYIADRRYSSFIFYREAFLQIASFVFGGDLTLMPASNSLISCNLTPF